MAKINLRGSDGRFEKDIKLAGGAGAPAARQDSEALLRRAVMASMLWEDLFYESGSENTLNIEKLVREVDASKVAEIAIEAREKQKLRHIPLKLVLELSKKADGSMYVRDVINRVVTRADQITDLLALHWIDKRKPIPNQMKKGLADVFLRMNEYGLAKYNRDGKVKLKDALRVVHPKPLTKAQSNLFMKLDKDQLEVVDTWETALKATNKKETWTRLLIEKKLPDLAFLRNLRNLLSEGVELRLIRDRLKTVDSGWLLPLNFLNAAKVAPSLTGEIEEAMFRCYAQREKLEGVTAIVLDVSGSMESPISSKSQTTRLDAAKAMAIMARETCETPRIFCTAGSDGRGVHASAEVKNYRGFALEAEIGKVTRELGGGGIFTRQMMEWLATATASDKPDRVIVFSDSQDCEQRGSVVPKMFAERNYIIDVSAHARGINYKGVWTAEVSGWSEYFLEFIRTLEGAESCPDNSRGMQ